MPSSPSANPCEIDLVIVSTDSTLVREVAEALSDVGEQDHLRAVDNLQAYEEAVLSSPDLVLFDLTSSGMGLDDAMKPCPLRRREVPLIVIVKPSQADLAIDAVRAGAENFLFRDRLGRVVPAIWQARHNRDLRRRHARTTEALRSSELQLSNTGRIARVGGWSLELGDGRLSWTDQTKAIHEVPADYEPELGSAIEFYAPSARSIITKAVEAAIADGTPWDLELPLITARGRSIWVRAQGEAVSRDGRVVALVGAFQEITERKRAEERLAQQAALIDMVPDAIILRDLDHRVLHWNRSASRLYRVGAAEALGRDFRELPGLIPGQLEEADKTVRATGSWRGELRLNDSGGEVRVLDSHWTFIRDPEGWPASILSIDTDVTDRKRLELQFLRAQRMESIGTLAGGIAHDLNNILSPILMAGDLLKNHVQSESGMRLVENIGRSARRGADLVRQVLSFARGVDGERVPVQVRHIVREIEDIVTNTFPKNIVLETDVPRDLGLVVGDPTQINQVLVNLCVNARDAMSDGGTLGVTARMVKIDESYVALHPGVSPGSYVLLCVTDDGVGMPPKVLEHIFEPFFTTKEQGKGTGLGLSTVQAIVRSHGGFVNVYSEQGRGSTFKIYLPHHRDDAVCEQDEDQPPSIPRGDGEVILVVDDESAIRGVTKQTLQSFGYKVLSAEDGAAAVGLYAQHASEIALVITDMMMPVMDGAMLIAALRHIKPDVRIIASSGLASNSGAAKAANLRVWHFLPKPYSALNLLRLVREVLDAPASEQVE